MTDVGQDDSTGLRYVGTTVRATAERDGDEVVLSTTEEGQRPEWLLSMTPAEALELGRDLMQAATGDGS